MMVSFVLSFCSRKCDGRWHVVLVVCILYKTMWMKKNYICVVLCFIMVPFCQISSKNKMRQTGKGWRIVTACICALFSCWEISVGEGMCLKTDMEVTKVKPKTPHPHPTKHRYLLPVPDRNNQWIEQKVKPKDNSVAIENYIQPTVP